MNYIENSSRMTYYNGLNILGLQPIEVATTFLTTSNQDGPTTTKCKPIHYGYFGTCVEFTRNIDHYYSSFNITHHCLNHRQFIIDMTST